MTLLAESRLSLVAGAPPRALRYLAPTAMLQDLIILARTLGAVLGSKGAY
jgi:hypothetical protein